MCLLLLPTLLLNFVSKAETYASEFNRKVQLIQLTSMGGSAAERTNLTLKADLTQEESYHFQNVVKVRNSLAILYEKPSTLFAHLTM